MNNVDSAEHIQYFTEFLEALCLLPPTATTTTASLHNDGTSLSPGAHNPTTLHHTSHDSSVSVDSSPVASKTQSPQPKGMLTKKKTCI